MATALQHKAYRPVAVTHTWLNGAEHMVFDVGIEKYL